MQFRIDKHGQLHIVYPSADPKIEEAALWRLAGDYAAGTEEIYVASVEKTEELAMLLLPVARNFLKKHGVSSDL